MRSTFGPIVAIFTVYNDLYSYPGGIYVHTSGAYNGLTSVLVVGYDDVDHYWIVRNNWGTGWGDKGYGWLPYDYVVRGLAIDWWSLIKNEWVDTGQFGLK